MLKIITSQIPLTINFLPLLLTSLLCSCFDIPDVTSTATTEEGIVTKVYSGSDSGFKFISYAVNHKDNEIIVSDTLAESNFKVGDEIKFIAARIGLSKSDKTVSYEILDL